MTEMSLSQLIDPVGELIQADLFAEDGNLLVFRHDLIRERRARELTSAGPAGP